MAAKKIIQDALDRVLEQALKPYSGWGLQESIRTAWIMMPRGEGLKAVHMYPRLPVYDNLLASFTVPYWRGAEVERLRKEQDNAQRNQPGDSLKNELARIRGELQQCASVTGYAFRYGGVHIFKDLDDCQFRCNHEQHLPTESREELAFRSKAATRLELRGEHLGVLLLCDTALGGFGNCDQTSIEIAASLAAPFVARGLHEDLFDSAA